MEWYLWIKAFHVIAMVTWFAAIFYLPRLFVYHTMAETDDAYDRYCVMERKLYNGIMTPGAIATLLIGLWLGYLLGWEWFKAAHWFHVKIMFLLVLTGFHLYCGKLMRAFSSRTSEKSEKFFRLINEIPVIPLIGIIIMAVVKPF